MNSDLKKLLMSIDDKESCEFPESFDYIEQIEKVKNIKEKMQRDLGIEFEMDQNVQDASFFTELVVLEKKQKQKKDNTEVHIRLYDLSIRFSCFGNLVTIFSNEDDSYKKKYDIKSILEELKKEGYIYVDADELDEYYDGPNKYIDKGSSWWIRYFDYL